MAKKEPDFLRVLRLQAENIKRLSVVEITPEGNVLEIAGKNGHGKTSVLDCFSWAFGGEGEIQWQPIRLGEEQALIKIDLGDERGRLAYRLTRKFRLEEAEEGAARKTTTELKIEDAGGLPLRKPQTFLNDAIGELALDPLDFIRLSPKERLTVLKGFVPNFDFDKAQEERERVFDARTDVNRDAKRLHYVADTIEVPEAAPIKRVDIVALSHELQAAKSIEQSIVVAQRDRANEQRRLRERRVDLAALNYRLAELQGEILQTEKTIAALESRMKEYDADPLPRAPDTAPIMARIAEAEELNAQFDMRESKRKTYDEAREKDRESEALTEQIDAIDAAVRKAIEDADLPVKGMGLGERDVMLRGVDFDQASDAEKLRAALALAIAQNPKLRLIRIRDGSLLDSDAMKIIGQVAKAEDFLIVIERVIPDSPAAIVMEDGHIQGRARPGSVGHG